MKEGKILEFELQNKLVKKLSEHNLKISTVESCTGGLISKMITDVSGSSEVFDCGICSYGNNIKEKIVGVKNETLKKYGAVSKETALEMAKGVKSISSSDIAVSTTGIAGPGGGSPDKPVGTVYICILFNDSSYIERLNLSGTRDEIRNQTANYVLTKILEIISNL